MIIRKVTEEAVVAAAQAVHVHVRYGFKPYWRDGPRETPDGTRLGTATSITIRPTEGCTQRRRGTSGARRRIHAVCWHGHRDFFRALYALCPEAVIVTALARYEGAAHFERTFPATGATNLGSRAQPMPANRACDCARASTHV